MGAAEGANIALRLMQLKATRVRQQAALARQQEEATVRKKLVDAQVKAFEFQGQERQQKMQALFKKQAREAQARQLMLRAMQQRKEAGSAQGLLEEPAVPGGLALDPEARQQLEGFSTGAKPTEQAAILAPGLVGKIGEARGKGQFTLGQTRFGPGGGVVANVPTTEKELSPERQAFKALVGKNIKAGQSDAQARINAFSTIQGAKQRDETIFVDSEGNVVVSKGAGAGGIIDKIEGRKIREQASGLRAAFRPLVRLQKAILTNKEAFGRAAKLTLGAANIGRTLQGLGGALAGSVTPATPQDRLAAEALALLSNPTATISSGNYLLQVATVAQAIANNPSGRISDRDMIVAERMIAGSTEPEDVFPRLVEAMQTIEENYNDLNARTGGKLPALPARPVAISRQELPVTPKAIDRELAEIDKRLKELRRGKR